MPLIVLVGHPCSGKSRRAAELAAYFSASTTENGGSGLGMEVTVVSVDGLKLNRATMFSSSESERRGRAALKSALERFVSPSPQKLLIFDYLNSIKGYRYEAWCRAREAQTPMLTLFVDTPVETCREWNATREPEEMRYPSAAFDDLVSRMEAPNEEKRWDQPLFRITDPAAPLPLEAMAQTLVTKAKVVPANIAVMPARMESGDYLSELDRVTGDILRAVLAASAQDGADAGGPSVGDSIVVPHTKSTVLLARRIHLAELRRVQSQYVKLARLRTPDNNPSAIATSFVDHLNVCIRNPQSTGAAAGAAVASAAAAAAASASAAAASSAR